MATIRDVAGKAGVSATTVSHTINGTRFVDPETKERVWAAVRELRYRPNSLARGLRRRESRTIGLVVPDISNPLFADLARAIEDAGQAEGYQVVFGNSDHRDDKEASYVESFLSSQVDGLILASDQLKPSSLEQLERVQLPTVVMPGERSELPVDLVMGDDETAGELAARYLLELGHQRIGCIAGPAATPSGNGRINGFRRILALAGAEFPVEALAHGDFRIQGGRIAMTELLERDLGLTAVFAANDLTAIGALSALRTAGLRVPDDISLIGFDGIPFGTAVTPTLTTIDQQVAEIGREAVRVLLNRTREPDAPPRQVLIAPMLVVRESCRSLHIPRGR